MVMGYELWLWVMSYGYGKILPPASPRQARAARPECLYSLLSELCTVYYVQSIVLLCTVYCAQFIVFIVYSLLCMVYGACVMCYELWVMGHGELSPPAPPRQARAASPGCLWFGVRFQGLGPRASVVRG